ncbi:hypothetical protein AK812_SmicGene25836 [Symbiodinium microadriaticum]|uniref:Uncharacterized protein n=1 Tax=Symbiodinium microadriaticum TaxID=2951 RepID=A0A1Q9DB06_SYMMI|nr:hypothetical protein AK812_SmicGene25836 [Symbiodinium microadriaticum]
MTWGSWTMLVRDKRSPVLAQAHAQQVTHVAKQLLRRSIFLAIFVAQGSPAGFLRSEAHDHVEEWEQTEGLQLSRDDEGGAMRKVRGLLQTLVTSWEKPLDRLRPDSRATVFQTLLVVELCQAFDELASDWL